MLWEIKMDNISASSYKLTDVSGRVDVPFVQRIDFHSAGSVQLVMHGAGQSGGRVVIELLDETRKPIGRKVVIAIDWIGVNDLRLWPSSFLDDATGEPGSDGFGGGPYAFGLGFLLQSEGVWPTNLTIERVALLREEPLWTVDGADTVIEAGWHYAGAAPHRWEIDRAGTTVEGRGYAMCNEQPGSCDVAARSSGALEYRGRAPWLTMGYKQEEEPRKFVIYREFEIPVGEYSEILFKASWDSECLLSAIAESDTGRIAICDNVEPSEMFQTFSAGLSGTLKRVTLILDEQASSPRDGRDVAIGLFWILLRMPSVLDNVPQNEVTARMFGVWDPIDDDPETKRLSVPVPPFSEPAESTTPVGDIRADGLPFGFFVSRDNLDDMRKRCLEGASRDMFEAMRREADRAIATELVDRNTYGNAFRYSGMGKPKGYRGAGMGVFASLTAFVHVITGEEKYAVACRRWILRAAGSDRWIAEHGGPSDIPRAGEQTYYCDIFTGTHPMGFYGYMNQHFVVADIAHGLTIAYDLLYHCFSPEERETVENAMAEHGLFHLWDKMLYSWESYVRMNQGVLIALPLLMQTAFLKRRNPVYKHLFDKAVEFLSVHVSLPWNDEGVMGEGPAYGNGTLGNIAEALPVLAACTGKEIESFLPSNPEGLLAYLCHCRSTWRTPGKWPHFLGLSDGGEYGWFHTPALVFFARYLGSSVAEFLIDELDDPPQQTIANVFYDREIPDATPPELPASHIYRDQPMVFFRTGWREGDALVMMNAIREVTGHGHEDRGSVIFEFNGEALVLDPGMLSYNDTRSDQWKKTFCHNCLNVEGRSQLGGTSRYEIDVVADYTDSRGPTPGDPMGVDWAIVDLTAVYPEASRYYRHLIYLRPATVVLFDDIILDAPERVGLNFNLLGEVTPIGTGFLSTTEHTTLSIASVMAGSSGLNSRSFTSSTMDWATHWPDLTTHRLAFTGEVPQNSHRWLTVLSAAPQNVNRLIGLDRNYFAESSWQRFGREVSVATDGEALVADVVTGTGVERIRFQPGDTRHDGDAVASIWTGRVQRMSNAPDQDGDDDSGNSRVVTWDGNEFTR